MSDRHPLRPDLIDVDAYRREHGLDAENRPLSLSPEAREAADHPGEVAPMADQTPAVVAKTPVLQDKRLWVAVATVICLLLSNFLHINLNPETVAGVIAIVVGWIAASATKEASVAKAIAANQGQSQQ